jgi:hypothetical protein
MTKLIALALIAAGTTASIATDIQPGEAFEISPEDAEPLLTNRLAQLAEPSLTPAVRTKSVKVRVLMACPHGQPDDVITLNADIAKQAEVAGQVDTTKAAVAYAMTLPQNNPPA